MNKKTFTLAGPSFVIAGSISQNVMVLKDHVREVGLTLFDSRACLEYTPDDLPPSLSELGLIYHVHLPLDLNWAFGADHVFRVVSALVRKTAFLSPDKFVLHPPKEASSLERFAKLWTNSGYDPRLLLVENICGNDLSSLWEVIEKEEIGICLDIGHVLAYDQMELLKMDLVWKRTGLVHVYGKEDSSGHHGLAAISREGRRILELMLSRLEGGIPVLLEVFSLQDFLDSRDILFQMADSWGVDFV